MRCSRREGHTLPQLLVALMIVGILVSLALPSFVALRDEWALRTATGALLAGLAETRMAALTRSSEAWLCPTRDGLRCARGAAGAFLVMAPQPAAPEVLRTARFAPRIELNANRPAAIYYRWPRAASPVTLTLCATPARRRSRLVIVSQAGRPRVESAGPC
jgi:Tfp pilus assembly protein FimT